MNNGILPPAPTGEYDFFFKILILGESGVGKTSLLLRFVDDTFTDKGHVTINGGDVKSKIIKVNESNIKLILWDTAGQERFRTITSSFYRGATGAIIAFDLTDKASFTKAEHWMADVRRWTQVTTPIIMVGTKSDATEQRAIERSFLDKYAEAKNILYLETSAKDNVGVNEAFITLASLIAAVKTSDEGSGSKIDLKKGSQKERCSCPG